MLYGNIDPGQHCSGNGLMPDGTKPLPEPVLTIIIEVELEFKNDLLL